MVSLIEYAQIARAVYKPANDDDAHVFGFGNPPGFTIEDRSVFEGGSFWSSGLQMRAYRKYSGGDVVIAFKGTRPVQASDLLADLKLVLEMIPKQAYEAIKHTTDWMGQLKAPRVTLVGHSLGGGIAQVVGITGDIRFVTFNAPGMWTNTVGLCAFKKLKNTTKAGVNWIKWGDAVGNFGKHIGDTQRVRSTGHGIQEFIDFLKFHPARDKDPLA